MTQPFTLVSATDNNSGITPRILYTVPAGKQAFIKSVIAFNTTDAGRSVYLDLDDGSNITRLSGPSIAASASSNLLAGTLVMSEGEQLVQSSSVNRLNFSEMRYNGAGTVFQSVRFTDITFANSLYVAIGSNAGAATPYNNAVFTSPDGITWTWRDVDTTTTAAARTLNSVTYGAGLFVVVGNGGFIATSPDGITWTTRTSAHAGQHISSVIFAGGKFVAAGGTTQSDSIQTSTDGITWTARTGSTTTITATSVQLAYESTSGLYAMSTGQAGNAGGIQTSPDGITWTQRTLPTTAAVVGVQAKTGTFVAVPNATDVCVSTNGVDWSPGGRLGSGANGLINMFRQLNGLFIATRASNIVCTSTDGTFWVTYSSGLSNPCFASNGTEYIVASVNQSQIKKSENLGTGESSTFNLTASIIEV